MGVMSRFNMNLALLCLWTILATSRGHSMLSSTDTKLKGLELKRQRRSPTFYLLDLPKADLPTGVKENSGDYSTAARRGIQHFLCHNRRHTSWKICNAYTAKSCCYLFARANSN